MRKSEDEIFEEIQEIRNLKSPREKHRGIDPEYFADIPLLTKEEFEQCVELQQW